MDPAQQLVSLLPNFRLSLVLFLIVHCHSSQAEDAPVEAGGQPRFFSMSAGSQIFGELLVSLPMSVFLPSLVMRRSVMTTPTSRSNDDFDDVGYGDNNVANLTSLDQIFSTFGLDELECQKRFICEALQEPKKFDPISSIIFLLLRDANPGNDAAAHRKKFNLENSRHYREAFAAGQHGASNTTTTTSCIAMFPHCSIEGSTARLIDFPILEYWQKLSDVVPLTITV